MKFALGIRNSARALILLEKLFHPCSFDKASKNLSNADGSTTRNIDGSSQTELRISDGKDINLKVTKFNNSV